jgi:molecular chaperone DnaK
MDLLKAVEHVLKSAHQPLHVVVIAEQVISSGLWKSSEQNDVTPSAIYIDRRGNKYVGKRAYDSAPHSPDNSALLFKRLMGTSTPVQLSAVSLTKTPEKCSAEVLKVLFGYLPEDIRNDPDTGTVITVPAA